METPASVRAIIIEDHTMVRELLASLLQDELHFALAAQCTTVQEGITACLHQQPDLVIIDWMLPDGRGFEVVRATRARLPRTRWLFLTSNEQEHIVREAVSLGVHGFVMKQSPLDVFCTAIETVARGEAYYCTQSARLLVESMRSEAALGTNLTAREREVLRGFARGENLKGIAARLGVTAKTAQNHFVSLKDKLGIQEPANLVRYAIKHGLVEPP
jgi:DNA-binding NarL/FixJ family response regulator